MLCQTIVLLLPTQFTVSRVLGEHHCALENRGSLAIAEHVFSANHQVDPSKATVIDAHPYLQTCCMPESCHIQHHQTTVNRVKGTLPKLYATLLD